MAAAWSLLRAAGACGGAACIRAPASRRKGTAGALPVYVSSSRGTQCVEVPAGATVADLAAAAGLPPHEALVFAGARLPPEQALCDVGISAEACVSAQRCGVVQYGSLAPRGEGGLSHASPAHDEDDEGGEVDAGCTQPPEERWLRSEYGDLAPPVPGYVHGGGEPWGQEFVPPDGCGAIVGARFRARGDGGPARLRLALRRWLPYGLPGDEECRQQCGPELWGSDPVDVPAGGVGDIHPIVWEGLSVPVVAGERYILLLEHAGGEGDPPVVHFGKADDHFSNSSVAGAEGEGPPEDRLYSRHAMAGYDHGTGDMKDVPLEECTWGVLGGGDLAFRIDFA